MNEPLGLTWRSDLVDTARAGLVIRYDAHVEDLPSLIVDLACYGSIDPTCLVVAFGGAFGKDWWADPIPPRFDATSLPSGTTFVDVRWPDRAWFEAPNGYRHGPLVRAAYVASVVNYLVAAYPTAKLSLLGASSGATAALNYAAFYDPDHRVSSLVMTSGPLVKIKRMCRSRASFVGATFVDRSYGFGYGGPCHEGDIDWAGAWDAADASKTGSIDHEQTKITAIFGTHDWMSPGADERAEKWLADKPNSSVVKVPAGHIVHETEAGMQAIISAF